MGKFEEALKSNTDLAKRFARSEEKRNTLVSSIAADVTISQYKNLCIYAVGSIGRKEVGDKSDLDLFTLSPDSFNRLAQINLFSSLIQLNKSMGFPDFSGDGKFLKVFNYNEHAPSIGSPLDDHENWFTARMLLLLESTPIFNEILYTEAVKKIANIYFRDSTGKKTNFRPIFFLNDLLRFWRTLCLNYEIIRSDTSWPWRKKNINLKYSRRLTIFSTVLYLLADSSFDEAALVTITSLTPLERLARALDIINDPGILSEYENILSMYENFLKLKEDSEIEEKLKYDKKLAETIEADGVGFRKFIYKLLNHSSINQELKEFLVV